MIKKILHTSDWHIGRRLKNHERYDEFKKFFAWLEEIIKSENIDALLVAGDIFDNTTPSARAQDLYYSFLGKIARTNCRHIVIISGNHDSPAFIDAPKDLLKLFKIHVTGSACENPEDEVKTLYDDDGQPELIVCAVPYLRDRDVRTLKACDDVDSLENSLLTGIKNHYEKVFAHASEIRGASKIPVIGMGHLFARGGKVTEGDGVRSLYVGTAVEVGSDLFPDFLTYTALGHLHSPQKISRENIRYSGSPLSMGFGEAGQKKAVYVVELDGEKLTGLKEISVPTFQRLERIEGDMDKIFAELARYAFQRESIWLDITYTGSEAIGDLQEKIDNFLKDFPLIEVLSIRDESRKAGENISENISKNLEEIKPLEMLEFCFEKNNTPDWQREIFIPMYQEILLEAAAE
ncbi:MAG: exonuclease SbcCD subunit D C-terminal domain-containing protein [Synergistaceae bacterium]|nr:exonuclease SbcCD subunit D C-terminal domain-containing protein [Synergistaceae bacterium]